MTNTSIYRDVEVEQIEWPVLPQMANAIESMDTSRNDARPEFNDSTLELWAMEQLCGISDHPSAPMAQDTPHRPTLPERLAEILLVQSQAQDGIIEHFNRQAVAEQLGTARETVSALLRTFHRQKLIDVGYQQIKLVDRRSLVELAWY